VQLQQAVAVLFERLLQPVEVAVGDAPNVGDGIVDGIGVVGVSKHSAVGEPFGDGRFSFPDPGALAGATEQQLRRDCTTGYRSPYLLELADRVASGRLAIEEWRTTPLSTVELFQTIRSVKGVGPYAAGNILKLLGRYDYLGLDSWVRGRYAELHSRGRKVKDSTIERAYARFGTWRGLFFWLEMTRDWQLEKF